MRLSQFVLVSCVLVSCEGNTTNDYIRRVEDTLNRLSLLNKSAKVIMIIPSTGCSGCIADSEKFLLENTEKYNKSVLFVLTSYQSKKELQIKLGKDVIKCSNVIFDKENIFFQNNAISIYPILYYVSTRDIVEINPENKDAIHSLRTFLSRGAFQNCLPKVDLAEILFYLG